MKVFIDTSFFVEFFLGNSRARGVFKKIKSAELCTSLNVIDECTYILMKLMVSQEGSQKSHYDAIRRLKTDKEVYEKCLETVKDFYQSLLADEIKVLEPSSWEIVLDIMRDYRLLPNDALIAATCRRHGIGKIATFDKDF